MPAMFAAYCHKLQQQPSEIIKIYMSETCTHLCFDNATADSPSIIVTSGSLMERLFHQSVLSSLHKPDNSTGNKIKPMAKTIFLLYDNCL